MQINLGFSFDSPAEAAAFLETLNGTEWPTASAGRPARPTDERPPWEEDEADAAQSERKAATADPWAEDATPAKPAKAASGVHPDAGKLFPANGRYEKATPADASRAWTFGVDGAPECDCGYPAALVSGKKCTKKWEAYWCPIGFTKDWKNKCGFSEFA